MNRFFAGLGACLAAVAFATFAAASPISYSSLNVPVDTPQAMAGLVIGAINSSQPFAATQAVGSGTTTATASSLRSVVSVTGLTTAAGVTSATMTVTNTTVVATSTIFCQANGYAGTGNPIVVNIVPGAGSFTFALENTHASAALNATVPVACFVYN